MKHLSNEQLQKIIERGQWYLTDEEEKLREQSAQDFTDPHPLTDAVLDIAERLKAPITTARIIEELYKPPEEENPSEYYQNKKQRHNVKHLEKSTRQNQNIINDILQSNGYEYARKKDPDTEKRVRGWWLMSS